ncbi:MAG: galactose-1-phosphate uridylyltransferase [Dehalococcoidia bacterium]
MRVERADGRYIQYYAFDEPLPPVLDRPQATRPSDGLELRWNPLLGEHVVISTGRQDRTFLPPADACPLCPTDAASGFTSEIPSTTYEIVAFENRFPSLRLDAAPVASTSALERRERAAGVCEVLVYTPRHDATLSSLPEAQVRRLVDVWADRYAELSARPEVAYVFIFENRGREIGVTLTHPHGQIYAFPYVPPRVQREHELALRHVAGGGGCLLCDVVAQEIAGGERIVATAEGFVAYVPFAARLPYEVHVAAAAHRASLLELSEGERAGLARIVRTVQATYDNLWGFAMPYTMSMHQRPADGGDRAGDHLHIEFAPPYRTRDKLKYLAGIETGAGTFINDTAPEDTARALREAAPRPDGASGT